MKQAIVLVCIGLWGGLSAGGCSSKGVETADYYDLLPEDGHDKDHFQLVDGNLKVLHYYYNHDVEKNSHPLFLNQFKTKVRSCLYDGNEATCRYIIAEAFDSYDNKTESYTGCLLMREVLAGVLKVNGEYDGVARISKVDLRALLEERQRFLTRTF